MKRRALILAGFLLPLLVALPPVARAATVPGETESLFGLTNLWTLHLTVSDADWQRMGSRGTPRGRGFGNDQNDNGIIDTLWRKFFGGPENGAPAMAPGPFMMDGGPGGSEGASRFPWGSCTVEVSGQRLTNVGVRFKGVSSLVRAPNTYKRPFKLDFDRGSKGRRFMGVEEFYLNNNVNDATQMREALACELFRRAGLPAPRTAFARVYLTIPGKAQKQHLGLYTLVEAVEGDFLKRHYESKKGLLLKPESMPGLPYLGEDWNFYRSKYHPEGPARPDDPQLTRRFIEFVRFIQGADQATFAARIGEYLEPDPFLRFVALHAILSNVDSFIGNGHNYYLFLDARTRRSHFITWDVNEAFGMHPVSGPSGLQLRHSVLQPTGDPNQLIDRFLDDPALGLRYRAHCAALLTNVFAPAQLAADIDRIAAITRPVVFTESTRAREDFERTVLGTKQPDQGDVSQPRHDREWSPDGYRPWGFPGMVSVDNMPLKDWVRGRELQVRGELEGRTRGIRPRPRL